METNHKLTVASVDAQQDDTLREAAPDVERATPETIRRLEALVEERGPFTEDEGNVDVGGAVTNDEVGGEDRTVVQMFGHAAATAQPKSLTYAVPDNDLCVETLEFERDTVGFIQRIAYHYGGRFSYCPETETWYDWDGKVHRADKDGLKIFRAAMTTARSIKDSEAWLAPSQDKEAKRLAADHERLVAEGAGEDALKEAKQAIKARERQVRNEFNKFSDVCQRGTNIKDAVAALRIELAVPEAQWGGPADKLNVQNGVLNLRTGKLEPHLKDYHFTQITPTDYRPDATSATLEKILDHLSDSRPEVMDFIQRYYGTGLTALVSFAAILYIYGESQVGKSTLINAFCRTLGEGFDEAVSFASSVSASAFTMSDSAHDEGFDHLRPYRLVNVLEAGTKGMLDAGKLNQISGSDIMNSRRSHGRTSNWRPRMSIVMTANPKARIPVENEGLRERFLPYQVTRKLAKEDRTIQVKHDLESVAGMEAMLAWAVEGAKKWFADGGNHAALKAPAWMKDELQKYTKDMDEVQTWLNEEVILVDPMHDYGFPVTIKAAWNHFKRKGYASPKMQRKAFVEALEDKGFTFSPVRERWKITNPTTGQPVTVTNKETYVYGIYLKESCYNNDHRKFGPLCGNVPLDPSDMPETKDVEPVFFEW